jgi:hypothetical protein
LAITLLVLLTPVLNAQAVLDHSPLSGGVLAARAFRQGRIQFQHGSIATQHNPDTLVCSPAPCRFKEVDASEGGANPVNEHPIAANPSNALQVLTGGNDYNCGNIQGFFASGDGGSTWTRVCSPGSGGEGDPIVGYDLNNVAYAGGIQNGSVVDFISTDNGAHWGAPITVTGAQLGYLADKPWMEIDTSASSSRKNSIYVSTTQFALNSDSQIWVSHSTDGGHTWSSKAVSKLQHFPTGVNQFSDLAVGADGTVYLNWILCKANGPSGDCGGTNSSVQFSKSTDGGVTWSAEKTIATAALTPDPNFCCFYGALPVTTSERISDIPANAVFGSGATAKVYVTYYNWTGTQMQAMVTTSLDGGTTFGAPVRVTTATSGDEFFPWINVSTVGKISATWLDRRNDPANTQYQPMLSTSNNGTTWATSHALTNVKSSPLNDGFGGGFMGDYRTHVYSGKSVYADWQDTRTGTSQCEVGGASLK